MRKGVGELSSTPPLVTERSVMNSHNHKEPPLREQVKHKNWLFSKFIDNVFYVAFAVIFGLVIAGLFE